MNLNNPVDFARLTLDSSSGILDQLTGNGGNVWDIQEGAYGHKKNIVKFHVFLGPASDSLSDQVKNSLGLAPQPDYNAGLSHIDDTYGRRKAIYKFPYRNGQTTDDLGANGKQFDIDAIFHGQNYKRGLNLLLTELDDPTPGDFIHPVFGKIRCVPIDWTITHSHESTVAAAIRIRFITHDFDVSFQTNEKTTPSTFKGAIAAAVGFFAKINNVLNKIESNILAVTILKNAAKAAVAEYQSGYTSALVKLNGTFNKDGSNTDIPGLNKTQTGGIFPVVGSLGSVLQAIPDDAVTNEIIVALATQQATDTVIALRNQLNATIAAMSTNNGETLFHDEILELKRSAIAMQHTLELGIQSSQSQIIDYTVPRLMSVREVAYLNGLSLDRVYDLEVLNPSLLSMNYIEAGTVMKVLVV